MDFHGRTRNIGSLAISLGIILSFSLAYPASAEETKETKIEQSTQTMIVASSVSPSLQIESFEFELVSGPEVRTAGSIKQGSVPVSYTGGTLLDAARSQLGWGQDCTSLIENALRMVGYGIGDVGPMGFASYGVRVSPADAQPGDIMMRGGHAAIYAGNGVAIHGGFNGSTVETSIDGNPNNFAVIVRVQ